MRYPQMSVRPARTPSSRNRTSVRTLEGADICAVALSYAVQHAPRAGGREMSSEPLRGSQKHHLLRSQNSAFIYVVADAVGGASIPAHEAALRRVEPAGAQLVSKCSSSTNFSATGHTRRLFPTLLMSSRLGSRKGFQRIEACRDLGMSNVEAVVSPKPKAGKGDSLRHNLAVEPRRRQEGSRA